MARIKRHRNARSNQEMKHPRRKPNIPELVYKFLIADEISHDTERVLATKCRCCGQEKHYEIADSADTPRIIGKSMGYKVRRDGRISKSHGIKRHPISKDLPISYLQKCVGSAGTREARKYIKRALDFGVESGYLIPSDPTYKVLRVSSGLMKSDSRRNKISTYDRALSKERDTPIILDDSQVQEQRKRRRRRGRARRSRSGVSRRRSRGRRRRRRRRSRSRSRSRGRTRHSSPQNPEEVTEHEAEDDYEIDENDPKNNIHTDDIEREPKTMRSNQSDEGQSTKKAEENGSDLSVDEDETDDEEEGKKADITKS